MRNELFIIEPKVWEASDGNVIKQTAEGLREMGLYRMPFPTVTVRLPGAEFLRFTDQGREKVLHDHLYADITIHEWKEGTEPDGQVAVDIKLPTITAVNTLTDFHIDISKRMKLVRKDDPRLEPEGGSTCMLIESLVSTAEADPEVQRVKQLIAVQEQVKMFLIVMLATRNARKTTTVDKLAKLGIGKRKYKHRYSHITTISLPKPEDMEDDPEHKPTGKSKIPHLRRGHIRSQHYGPKGAYVKKIWIEPVFVNADPDFVSDREAYNVTIGGTP